MATRKRLAESSRKAETRQSLDGERQSQETENALIKQELRTISGKLDTIEYQLENKYAQATETALIRLDIAAVRQEMNAAVVKLEGKMVTQDQFWPVKATVIAGVSIILSSFTIGVVALVFSKGILQ